MITANRKTEQLVRDEIDRMLVAPAGQVQCKKQSSFAAGVGVVVRVYQTGVGSADYSLFLNRKFIGVSEARRVLDCGNCLARKRMESLNLIEG